MDEATESRSDSLADNKKPSQNPHLSDQQLLLALDGELSAQEAALVKGHLHACWSCRARSEQIEEAIADVVKYRDHLTKSFFPISPGGRASFVAQLEQLARSVGRPSLWSRLAGLVQALRDFPQGVGRRRVWIGGLLMAIFVFFLVSRSWEVSKVSASELLEKAQVSEVRALYGVPKPVVYQKVRIRIGSQILTQTIYRDADGKRQRNFLDLAGGVGEVANQGGLASKRKKRPQSTHSAKDDEIRLLFLTAGFKWQDPLSPATYEGWHDSLSEKQDKVSVVSNGLLTLTTTTPIGSVSEGRLSVRIRDFHPVAENLRLRDAREIEVDELAWDVLPMEVIDPTIFAPEPISPPELAHRPNLAPPTPRPTVAELAESELQARVAIHADGADLGEEVELGRDMHSGQRCVLVQGIVSTLERKKSLLAALQGIPHVELRLQTVEEAMKQQNQVTPNKPQGAEAEIVHEALAPEIPIKVETADAAGRITPAPVIVGGHGLEEQLVKFYPKAKDRTVFINQAVELGQKAMAQAWALRRLRDRYAPYAVAELSPSSRQTLELLIRDHASLLQQQVDELRNMVSPLVPSEPMTEVLPPKMIDAPMTAAAAATDWRYAFIEIFPEVQRVQENLADLLAGPGETASETQALALGLQMALAKLQDEMPVLYQDVRGPFLSDPNRPSDRSTKEGHVIGDKVRIAPKD